jgi:transmembrane sensor
MEQNRLSYLLQVYAANKATKAEVQEMFRLLDASPDAPELLAAIMAGREKTAIRKISLVKRWLPYAAAILIIVTGAIIFINKSQQPSPVIAEKNIIVPGSDKAILTLSDGKKVELSNAGSETITDGVLTINNKNGELIYGEGRGGLSYNTMSTPRGGQYKLTLSDGTKVWLNAASSITFPVAFTGDQRKVLITGEAYFDIAENKSTPFIVQYNNEEIKVLGTEFNINAYADGQAPKTTLISGAVKINSTVLKPGEQYENGKIKNADISMATAWKNGYFKFAATPLPEVLRQLSRWYDITFTYPSNKIPEIKFDGRMGRNLQLPQVLRGLEQMGVKCKMEGRNLIIL